MHLVRRTTVTICAQRQLLCHPARLFAAPTCVATPSAPSHKSVATSPGSTVSDPYFASAELF